jgi:L-ascorbate metabolism protein UlaG (beta-lactamase superfamily)
MGAVLKGIGVAILFLIVAFGLAVAIVPRFLDRIYYRGAVSDHFDGARFFNPDGDDTFRAPGGRSRGGFLWRYLTGSDGRPAWPETVAVTPSKPAARVEGDAMVATWIGHATMLVQTQGLNILTDPIYAEKAGPFGLGPQRVTRPGVAFADLPKIDVVVVSHNHYDHMDLKTLKRLWDRDRPLVVTSLGNDAILRGAGVEAKGVDWGTRMPVKPGVELVVTRNHHWGSRWFADRNRALWSSFTFVLPGGNFFFAGDTGLGDGKWADEAAALGPVRLAAIPIGAFRFQPGEMGIGSHIGPVDAVEVYRRLGAHNAVPIHWGTFRLSYEKYDTPPRLLAATTACTGQTGFAAHRIGAPFAVPALGAGQGGRAMSRDALLACLDTPAVQGLE